MPIKGAEPAPAGSSMRDGEVGSTVWSHGDDDRGEGLAHLGADELALRFLPLARAVVADVAARVPASVDRTQLLSAGLVALTEAARAFEAGRDGDFELYATARLRSSLLDVLRTTDLSDRGTADRGVEPAEAPAQEPADRLVTLRAAIDELSVRHRRVVRGYFLERADAARLASDLGVAEAEIVRLRTEALMLLRDALRESAGADGAIELGRGAARSASYAAVSSRRSLLRASVMPDRDELGRGA